MSKSITVKSCAFVHEDDIDPEQHVDAEPINKAMIVALVRARNALEHSIDGYGDFHRANMQICLQSAQSTHAAIRKVLGWGDDDPMSVDALALARLPLESLFNMCAFTEKPDYVELYVRDGWRKQYEHFLLQREETQKLKRFEKFSSEQGPASIGAVAKIIGITKAQIATVEHDELDTPMPDGLALDRIGQFPTPGRLMNQLPTESNKRKMLRRLYPEYVFLCSFAHGLPDSNLFKMMFNKKSQFRKFWTDETLKETFRKQVAERAYITSLLSLVQSATEVTVLYPGDVELKAGVITAWQEISKGSLLCKAIWNIRAKTLLGVIG